MMHAGPTISLCMIVKNEEKFLPGCLASAAPYVDEMVVVDTGSTDRTVEIARSFGARVYHFDWVHDFAAARNESLRHATGDWVLQLDADERLDLLGSPQALREAAMAPGVDGYVVLIVCHRGAQDQSNYSVSHNYRFFRKLPGIHYEREVHESVEPFLLRAGARTANAPFVIEHEGYRDDGVSLRGKLERNLEILKRRLEQTPQDPFALYYLGATYTSIGRLEEGLKALEQGLELEETNDCLKAMMLNAMSSTYLTVGNIEKTIESAKQSLNIKPNQNTAHYFLGRAYYSSNKYKEALPHLLYCYQYCNLPTDKKTTSIPQEYHVPEYDILKAIAVCFANIRDYHKSVIYARRMLQINSQDPEIHHIMGLAFANLENYSAALHHLEESLALGLEREKVTLALAVSHFKLGALDRCVELLMGFRELDAEAVEGSFRLLLLLARDKRTGSGLPALLERKDHLLERVTFEQLGQLVSSLALNGHRKAMESLFGLLHHRLAEVEALLGGVMEYFATQNRLPELLPTLRALNESHPSHAVFLAALGIASIKQRDFLQAIEVYSRLIALAPENPSFRRTLAGLYASVGDRARAHQVLKQR